MRSYIKFRITFLVSEKRNAFSQKQHHVIYSGYIVEPLSQNRVGDFIGFGGILYNTSQESRRRKHF